jgi:hypothetical protein
MLKGRTRNKFLVNFRNADMADTSRSRVECRETASLPSFFITKKFYLLSIDFSGQVAYNEKTFKRGGD